MLNSKQKCFLRGKAQLIKPVFQIGKDGITDPMLTDIRNYLNKHELMKISILNNCPMEKDEVAEIFTSCGFEVVQVIGSMVILYKKGQDVKNPIILP